MPDLSAPVQAVSAAVQNLVLVSEVCLNSYGIKLRHFLVEILLINKLSTASLYRPDEGCSKLHNWGGGGGLMIIY